MTKLCPLKQSMIEKPGPGSRPSNPSTEHRATFEPCVRELCAWWIQAGSRIVYQEELASGAGGKKELDELLSKGHVLAGEGVHVYDALTKTEKAIWRLEFWSCCIPEIVPWLENIADASRREL